MKFYSGQSKVHNVATAQTEQLSTAVQSRGVVARGVEGQSTRGERAQRVEYGAAAAQISTGRVRTPSTGYSIPHEYIDIHNGLARAPAHAADYDRDERLIITSPVYNNNYLRLFNLIAGRYDSVTD